MLPDPLAPAVTRAGPSWGELRPAHQTTTGCPVPRRSGCSSTRRTRGELLSPSAYRSFTNTSNKRWHRSQARTLSSPQRSAMGAWPSNQQASFRNSLSSQTPISSLSSGHESLYCTAVPAGDSPHQSTQEGHTFGNVGQAVGAALALDDQPATVADFLEHPHVLHPVDVALTQRHLPSGLA
jgi:hypothetical protein